MPERVALHLGAGRLELGDDVAHPGPLGQEDVDPADLVHDGAQPLRLGLEVDLHLGDVDRVHRPPLRAEPDRRHPLLLGVPGHVVARRRGGEPAARASHHLVHDEHPRVRAVLGHHVPREQRGLLRRGDRTEALPDRDDVVVDGLRQPHHGEPVVVLPQVGGEVGRGGVGVVAADGVQHVDAVGGELLGRHLQRRPGPPATSPCFTQSAVLVSLTRQLPIGEPPNRCSTPARARVSSSTTTLSPVSSPW